MCHDENDKLMFYYQFNVDCGCPFMHKQLRTI